MENKTKLDNIDKSVLDLLQKRGKGTMPSFISTTLKKKPQAISRSLKKLKSLDLVEIFAGSDKRKKFYIAK